MTQADTSPSPSAAPAADASPLRQADHTPRPVDLSQESVAGEEDPGAGVNVPATPQDAPSSSSAVRPAGVISLICS